jgi:hypothetical protein
MVILIAGYAREKVEKRLDLKSFQGQTKAEEYLYAIYLCSIVSL